MLSIKTSQSRAFNGEEVTHYTLENQYLSVTVMEFGATITSIKMPDRNGKVEEVVLGFPEAKDYHRLGSYFGATVGRVAGRITAGKISLAGKNHQLTLNEGGNHLHGGGFFNQRIWESVSFQTENEVGVEFELLSLTEEAGYPGNLKCQVRFSLNQASCLSIHYQAESDALTLFNPTNHTYFNLSGNLKRDVKEHRLQMPADHYVPLATDLVPTGKLSTVAGTAFDFRQGRQLESGITCEDEQNKLVQGYDHAFVFNKENNAKLTKLTLSDAESGRQVVAETDMPAVVVYSGNQLKGEYVVEGQPTQQYSGVTLETQFLPDAPTYPTFGSIELAPGEIFKSETNFTFSLN